MPQLDVSTYPDQLFWLLVSFVSLWILMARFIVPRLESAITSRHQDAESVLAEALNLQEKADILIAQDMKEMSLARDIAREAMATLLEHLNNDHDDRRQRCQLIAQQKCAELETEVYQALGSFEIQPLIDNLCEDITDKLSTWEKNISHGSSPRNLT